MSSALLHSTTPPATPASDRLQLGCLAASPAAVRAAIDAGADWVRIPFRFRPPLIRNERNGRLARVMRYAHRRARKLVLDLDTPPGLSWQDRRDVIAWAVAQGFDAIVISDVSLALYCATHYPSMPLHIIAPIDICARTALLLKLQINTARILVPHDVSTAQLTAISAIADAELEVFASDVSSARESRSPAAERAGHACNDACYLPEQRTWDALRRLPLLASLGIRAIQVEPRSDMPDDVANMARVWRTAIDRCHEDRDRYAVEPSWHSRLGMA